MKKALLIISILFFVSNTALAVPRNANDAKKVVRGWLRHTQSKPLDVLMGQAIKKADSFTDPNGELVYHIVYLEPSGFVIVPADDEVEPIIGFAPSGEYIPSLDNPLGALVTRDLAGRVLDVRKDAHKKGNLPQKNTHNLKWSELEAVADQGDINLLPILRHHLMLELHHSFKASGINPQSAVPIVTIHILPIIMFAAASLQLWRN